MAPGPPEASRRALVPTATGAAGSGVALNAAPSYARGGKKPHRHQGRKLLRGRERPLVSRFSYGVTPALAAQVRAAGGARSWWERQLTPAAVPDAYADQLPTWWPSLTQSPQDMWAADKMGMVRA